MSESDPEGAAQLIFRINEFLEFANSASNNKKVTSMYKNDLTYKIIGCAMKVHNRLGPGFQEVIYQRCLKIEFLKADLSFTREQEQEIFYEGINIVPQDQNKRQLDLLSRH
jgi:hypothetical protein